MDGSLFFFTLLRVAVQQYLVAFRINHLLHLDTAIFILFDDYRLFTGKFPVAPAADNDIWMPLFSNPLDIFFGRNPCIHYNCGF